MANNGGCNQTTAQHEIELIRQQLLSSMSEDIEAAPVLLNEPAAEIRCCIFRVPQEACHPRVISIGPYHHGEQQLQMFEKHKWRYFRTMLDRLLPHLIDLEHLIKVVAPNEKMIRQCYSASTDNVSGHDLVEMIILDGCFIVEFLRQIAGCVQSDDILFSNSYMYISLVRDLLRLENQVPYFVLEDLFQATKVPGETTSLTNLALKFFDGIVERPDLFSESKVKGVHLLDLLHLSLVNGGQQDIGPTQKSSSYGLIGSASKLNRAGIAFEKREDSTFLEIKFDSEKGIMHIPKLTIDDTLQCILHNMVAFERCCVYRGKHFTAYAIFMGSLVDTGEDARLLCDSGVMGHNGVSKDGVASFFRDVCNDALCDLSKSHLELAITGVNCYVRHQRIRILFKQLVYALCHSAWTAIAAIVTLTGIIQTVYAVLQYYRRN